MDNHTNSAGKGAPRKPQVTEADVTKQRKLHAYLEAKGSDTSNITKLVTDEVLAETIEDGQKELAKVSFAMKKRFPADYKAYLKRYNELHSWLVEQTHTNTVILDTLAALNKEVRAHPATEQFKQSEEDRDVLLTQFAKTHSIALFGSKVCLRREDAREWILPEQLKQFWAHKSVPSMDGKPENIVSAFMTWDKAPRFGSVVFNPSHDGHIKSEQIDGDAYNLWQGWTVTPEEGEDDLLWWEILEAACGYNQDYVEYVTKWFADIFQNPARKPGTAIGITGRQGIGKSALVETIGMLMSTINRGSDSSKTITGAYGDFTVDDLLADYNEHTANKLLMYLDEATWGGSHVEQQRMKKVITKEYDLINPKFLGRVSLPCYHRVVFSANGDFYYRPDKDDRRLLPLEFDVSQINEKSYDFWKRFHKARTEGKMLQNLLHHMMSVPLDGWHPQEALKRLSIVTGDSMLENAKQPWEHWLKDIAEDGSITIEVDGEKRKEEESLSIENQTVSDKNFENAYILWARKHKCNVPWHSDAFKKERVKMLGERVRKMTNGMKYYVREVPSSEVMLKRLKEGTRWVGKAEVVPLVSPKPPDLLKME
jgi:Family of unknown function (DUF5906)